MALASRVRDAVSKDITMQITLDIDDEVAARLGRLIARAAKSADALETYSGAMPFSMDEYGVDLTAIQGVLETVQEIFDGKLPVSDDEDDEDYDGDDEDEDDPDDE